MPTIDAGEDAHVPRDGCKIKEKRCDCQMFIRFFAYGFNAQLVLSLQCNRW